MLYSKFTIYRTYAVGFKQTSGWAWSPFRTLGAYFWWTACRGSSRNNACDLGDAMIHVRTEALREAWIRAWSFQNCATKFSLLAQLVPHNEQCNKHRFLYGASSTVPRTRWSLAKFHVPSCPLSVQFVECFYANNSKWECFNAYAKGMHAVNKSKQKMRSSLLYSL